MPVEPNPAGAATERRLLLSIHDVSPRFAAQVTEIAGLFEALAPGRPFAMLVVPNFWWQAPLSADRGFCRQLRSWTARGVEMFLHGYSHRDEQRHGRWLDRWKANTLTGREGEFLGLSRCEAMARIRDGRALIEDIVGQAVAGFVAPAWLYGKATLQALAELDLPLAEDHFRVWCPRDGRVLARGPVISWATRSPGHEASSLAFARLARLALQPVSVVRVAVHPGDLSSPRTMASIRTTITAFMERRRIGSYGALLHRWEQREVETQPTGDRRSALAGQNWPWPRLPSRDLDHRPSSD